MLILMFQSREVLARHLAKQCKRIAEISLIQEDLVDIEYQDGDRVKKFVAIGVSESHLPLSLGLVTASSLAFTVHGDGSRTPHSFDTLDLSHHKPVGEVLDLVQSKVTVETKWKLTK